MLQSTTRTLARLHSKMDARGWLPSRFWPVQVAEIFRRLVRFDPRHALVLAEEPAFGRPEHSLFAALMEDAPRAIAARRMLATARRTGNWNPELLEFLAAALPAGEIRPALREKAADPALQDAIAVLLTRFADPADRALLVRALASTQTKVVRAAADALTKFAEPTPADITAAVRALARHETDLPTAAALQALLTRWAGGNAVGGGRFADWLAWLEHTHPGMAATLAGESAGDPSAVLSRLRSVPWDAGRAAQGKLVYQRIGCAGCHDNARQGPDLTGIAARFGREDLFRHIVSPNLAIAPPYRWVQIETRDGATHVGLPVYESPEATLLEVAGGAIVRVLGDEIVRQDATRRSSMPEGLLNGLSAGELADLYAFLRELK
jgi:putative heme-binding domain-containing protein